MPGAQAGGEGGDQAGAGGGNMATTAAATTTSCGHTGPGAQGGEHAQLGVRGAGAGLHPDLGTLVAAVVREQSVVVPGRRWQGQVEAGCGCAGPDKD